MLFFFAGYEIDFERIKGHPLRLAVIGWGISLVLAYALGGLLALAGIVLSLVFIGSAMATTAIGTLIPILRDAGDLRTRFGTYLLGAGAMGEFGPILLITLVFSTKSALGNATILLAFVALAVAAGLIAVRSVGRSWDMFERTLETSGQLAIRTTVVHRLRPRRPRQLAGPRPAAGRVRRRDHPAARPARARGGGARVEAHGGRLRLPDPVLLRGQRHQRRPDALTDDPIEMLKVPMFLALFLVVRGVPALHALPPATSTCATAVRWPSSAPPSCRWWWRSRRSRSGRGT